MELDLVITSTHPFFKLLDLLEVELQPTIEQYNETSSMDGFVEVCNEYEKLFRNLCKDYNSKILNLGVDEKTNYYQIIQPSYKIFETVLERIQKEEEKRIESYQGEKFICKQKIYFLEKYSGEIEKVIPSFKRDKEEGIDDLLDGIEDVKSISEQIRLIYELGILDHLRERYPDTVGKSNNLLAEIIGKILNSRKNAKIGQTTIQPLVNALINDNASSKNYPKETSRIKVIIESIKAD